MKKSLFLQCSLMMFCSLSAQNIENFLGKYAINAECMNAEAPSHPSQFYSYEIEILGDTDSNFDIKFFFDQGDINDFVKARFISERSFVINQKFVKDYDGWEIDTLYFEGDGWIDKDSLFIIYGITSSYNPIFLWWCTCKGKKIDVVGNTHSVKTNENTIYYDDSENVIVVGKAYQNEFSTFELFDARGRNVLKLRNVDYVDVAHLKKGVYFYRMSQNGKTVVSGKILKR